MPRWTAILPVKGLDSAKSRLVQDWSSPDVLALAFAQDALAALTACARVDEVVVVTSDPRVARVAHRLQAGVVDDTGRHGINAAVAWAAAQRPDASAILVTVSDLPALDPHAVDVVLRLAETHPSAYLPDASGAGTTMWCTTHPREVRTRFGVGSARAHLEAGAVDLSALTAGADQAALARARQDVDTSADLAVAVGLGVGPATRAALAAASPPT